MRSLRARIKARTDPSQVSRSLEEIVADLNPILRGWAEYFRHGASSKAFQRINEYVHLRLATYMSRSSQVVPASFTANDRSTESP